MVPSVVARSDRVDHYRNFGVDIDGYIARNEADWRRLDEPHAEPAGESPRWNRTSSMS